MSTPISTEYNGTKITYDIDSKKWTFELRGRERACEHLKEAQAIIDLPVRDKSTFKRVKVWHQSYPEGFELCEITSIAERPRYGGGYEVWITGPDKTRAKVRATETYPQSTRNDYLIAGIKALTTQIQALQKQRSDLEEKLQAYEVKDEEPKTK